MKRRIILSIGLALSLAMLSLIKSDSTAQAEQTQRYLSDTGVISLASDQTLLITVVRAAEGETHPLQHILQFRRMTYGAEVCNGGACKQTVASIANSGVVQLLPGESVTFRVGPDVHGNDVRGIVMSNSRDVKVNSIVFDTSTQRVVSIAHTTTTMYWP